MTMPSRRPRLAALLLSLLPWSLLAGGSPPAAAQPAASAVLVPDGGGTSVPAGSSLEGLSLDLVPLARITGSPPAAGSAGLRDDLAVLYWLQRNRTPQLIGATWMTLGRNPAVFSPAVGVDMAKSTPRVVDALRRFLTVVDAGGDLLKQRFRRARPFLSHPDLRPCLPAESGYAFPSGHASWYNAAARLLADLLPERRERLELIGEHSAANRVICGVHYPSDVMAGQRFGRAAAEQIIASPQWQRFRLDPAVQAELEQVRRARPEALPLLLP